MPEEILATFQVKRLSVLNENGSADPSLMPELSADEIWRMYQLMVLARCFDERAVSLQREGRRSGRVHVMRRLVRLCRLCRGASRSNQSR